MSGYALWFTDPFGATAAGLDDLDDLDELPSRVALEQLAHELSPVRPGGYVVTFTVTADPVANEERDTGLPGRSAADGHFYVRPADLFRPRA